MSGQIIGPIGVLPTIGLGPSPFILNLVNDTSVGSAPQSFIDGVNAAVVILQNAIRDPITANIQLGYGTYQNSSVPALIGTGSAEGQDVWASSISYATVRTVLQAKAATDGNSDLISSAGNLPSGSTIFGGTTIPLSRSVCKALGIGSGVTARDSTIDGATGFGTAIPLGNLVGAALHELTHALGRDADSAPFDLSRFTAVGTRSNDPTLGTVAWLSIDNGTTHMVDLDSNPSGDTSDLDLGTDAFDAFYNAGTVQDLSAMDKRILSLMGYKVI